MRDYIADRRSGCSQSRIRTYANANLVALGRVAGDRKPITTAKTTCNTAFPAHVAASSAAAAARNAKDTARGSLDGAIRPLVERLQAGSDVDEAEQAAQIIPVSDRTPSPAPVPTSARWSTWTRRCACSTRSVSRMRARRPARANRRWSAPRDSSEPRP